MYRKGLITLLLNQPMGVAEIARLLDMSPRDVEDDLHHLQKSLHHHAEYTLVVHPAQCRKCGFRFHADKFRKPGKCPQCHETWIDEPRLEVMKNH